MDLLNELDITRRCNDLITEYTHLCDLGDSSKVADLFTADAVWAMPALEVVGQEALRAHFVSATQGPRTVRHVCSNVLVEVQSVDDATAVVYVILYKHEGAGPAPISLPIKIGQYHDRFFRTAQGWRFAERRCSFVFA